MTWTTIARQPVQGVEGWACERIHVLLGGDRGLPPLPLYEQGPCASGVRDVNREMPPR